MADFRATAGSKDFWSGAIFLAVGLAFAGIGRLYPMGTTMHMGPGYFPMVLGSIFIARALLRPGPSVGSLAYNKLVLVTLSNVLFALLLRRLGLAGALILLVVVSAYASKRFRWPVALTLAVGLAVGSSIIFVWLLGLPLLLFRPPSHYRIHFCQLTLATSHGAH